MATMSTGTCCAPRAAPKLGAIAAGAIAYAGRFDRAPPVLGGANEQVLLRAAGPQIAPLYGTLCRSTPVFFLQDDHDHFDNDEATDAAVTFPPDTFMLRRRARRSACSTRNSCPTRTGPLGLPGALSARATAPSGLSESFGTLRYGRLAEVLLYDVRRTLTLAGPPRVFVAPEVERWLSRAHGGARGRPMSSTSPSNPPGWSAGKWGEWYPDILGPTAS